MWRHNPASASGCMFHPDILRLSIVIERSINPLLPNLGYFPLQFPSNPSATMDNFLSIVVSRAGG